MTVKVKYFGEIGTDIDYPAVQQAENAADLPITLSVSVMADGHPGYGVPIGCVLVTEPETVIPNAVGVDIACQAHLTLIDKDYDELDHEKAMNVMRECSDLFGLGVHNNGKVNHSVMDNAAWDFFDKKIPGLKQTAQAQLGTSGGGNHFVDLVKVDDGLVGILTHSGSRNVGLQLARYYYQKAVQYTQKSFKGIHKDLCWLGGDVDDYFDYMTAVYLMRMYAHANHELIHDRIMRKLGVEVLSHYETVHNSVWSHEVDGNVHRKGATPLENGKVGLVLGSSGRPSYLVEGINGVDTLDSAPHGSGRLFSRSEAKRRHDETEYAHHMAWNKITAIGVAQDETFLAYKNVDRILELHKDTMKPIMTLTPFVVVMGGKSDDGD